MIEYPGTPSVLADRKVPDVRTIAVLRANAVGDFIFVQPALQALRQTYPGAELVYLGRPWHREYLRYRPSPISRVEVVPVTQGVRTEPDLHEDPEALADFFARMRQEHFDIALQMHGGGKYSNPFINQLGARVSVGLKTPDAEPLDRWIPYIFYYREILRYMEVVSLVGAVSNDLEPHLAVTERDLAEAGHWLGNDSTPVALLHPGATDLRRRWPPERFAWIGDRLAEEGYRIVVTGLKEEEPIIGEVMRTMNHPVEKMDGVLSLGGLTGLLSKAKLVVSNDTGPRHMAEAVGTPTVGIYWCGNVTMAGPSTQLRHRALASWTVNCPLCGTAIRMESADRAPLGPGGCTHQTSFVADVSQEEVLNAVQELMSLPGA